MPRRSERDYEVVIPVRIKDETGRGARSVNSSVDKMAQQTTRDVERRQRQSESASQRLIQQERRHQQRLTEIAAQGEQQRLTQSQRLAAQAVRDKERAAERAATAAKRAEEAQTKATRRETQDRIKEYQRERREQQRIMDRAKREFEKNKKEEENAAKKAIDFQIREQKRLEREEVSASNRRRAYAARQAREAEREQHQRTMARSAAVQGFGQGMSGAGQGLLAGGAALTAGVSAPIVSLAVSATQQAISMDSLKRGLGTVLEAGDTVEKRLIRLQEVAKLPGLGFRESIQSFIQLRSIKLDSDLVERSLMAVGNALASVGKGKAELEGVNLALTQMVGKGKVQAEEVNQIAERLPIIRDLMKQLYGTTDTEQLQKKGLAPAKFIEDIVSALEKLPKMTSGPQVSIENMMDAIDRSMVRIGEKFLPVVMPVIDWIGEKLPAAIDKAIDWFDQLDPVWQKVVVGFGLLVVAAGPVLTVLGIVVIALGGLVTAAGALVGAISLPVVAAFAALGVVLVQAAAVAAVLAAAWYTNFGGIRDFTVRAWEVIKDHFIKGTAILQQAWGRMWPTIYSLATKYVEMLRRVWTPIFQGLTKAVEFASQYIFPAMRAIFNHVLNVVDLVLKLIDGDWKGAWDAFTRIVYDAKTLMETAWNGIKTFLSWWWDNVKSTFYSAITAIYDYITSLPGKFLEAARNLGKNFTTGLVTEISTGGPKIGAAIGTALAIAVLSVNFATIGAMIGSRVLAAINDAVKNGERQAREAHHAANATTGITWDEQEQIDRANKPPTAPAPYTNEPFGGRPKNNTAGALAAAGKKGGKGGTDPAQEKLRLLQNRIEEVGQAADEAQQKVDRLYGLGVQGASTYALRTYTIENERHRKMLDLLDQEQQIAITKKKDSAVALDEVEKKRREENRRHNDIMLKAEDQYNQSRLQLATRAGENYLAEREEEDNRAIEQIKLALEARAITHVQAEVGLSQIETDAYNRQDRWLEIQQNLYAIDSDKYQDYVYQRIRLADKHASAMEDAERRITDALKKDLAQLEQFDEMMTRHEQDNLSIFSDINSARLDQLERLGANPDFIKRHRALQDVDDRYEEQRRQLIADKAAAMAQATGEQRQQVEEVFRQRAQSLEELHQVRMQDIMVSSLETYAEKIHEIAGDIGDIFGDAFAGLLDRSKSFWDTVSSGFRQMFIGIVRDFIASRVRSYIESLFNPVYAGTSGGGTAGGGGAKFSLGNLFGLFGGGGGTASAGPQAAGAGGMNLGTVLQSLGGGGSGAGAGAGNTLGLLQQLMGGGSVLTPASLTQTGPWVDPVAFTKEFGLPPGTPSPAMAAFAGMLPMLGAGAGASIAGSLFTSSPTANIMGQVAGGALGLLGGLAGYAALTQGAVFGSGAGLGMFGSLAAAAPIIAPIAGALLIGAYFLNRNKRRRMEETKRDDISKGTGTAIWALIDEARFSSTMTVKEALARFDDIGAQYQEQISQLKDSKTKRHAQLQWQNDFLPLRRTVEAAARGSEQRAIDKARMRPVFAGGGVSAESQVIKVRPGEGIKYPGSNFIAPVQGVDRGIDSEFMFVPAGTRIFNRSEMRDAEPHQHGGYAGDGGSPIRQTLVIDSLAIYENGDGTADVKITSKDFEDVVVKIVKKAKKEKKLS